MISYNTKLVNGVMTVLEDAGIFDLSVPEIIKLVEEKFSSTNIQSESLKCRCGSDLPTLCNACFISEGFQNAQGSL